MLNSRNSKLESPKTGRSIELLHAVNEAAAYFQRSAHSETAVFRAYQEQMANLKLRGGLSLLDESGKHLTIRVVNYAGRIGKILTRLESLVGLKTEAHTFAVADVDIYRQVVETGLTHFIADSSSVVSQMVPKKAQLYLGRIVTIFGAKPAIYAPLISEGEVRGVINIVDDDLTADDMPALTAFANHIAVALDNARLFEESRRRTEELELMANISAGLRLAASRDEIVSLMLKQSGILLHGEGAAFTVRGTDTPGFIIEKGCGTLSGLTGAAISAEDGQTCHQVMESNIPYVNNDIQSAPAIFQLGVSGVTKAVVCVPLLTQDRAIGALWLMRKTAVTEKAVRLLTAVADMAATTIYRATLHEQLTQHADELEQRVAERTQELAAANERLTELDQLKSQLISNVSHELRTPITTLELYLDLFKHGKPEKREHYLETIEDQSHRLKNLVEDILDLSRLESGRDKIQFGLVQLNEVIEPIVVMQRARAQAKGLELRFVADETLPAMQGIHNQLAQVATNLVANSINYTQSGYIQVDAHLDRVDGRVCLSVSDTGSGIRPEDIPYIFDRFYRGKENEQGRIPGTGLGLAIVKDIVEIHGGDISVDSELGQGTTFRLWLPMVQEE